MAVTALLLLEIAGPVAARPFPGVDVIGPPRRCFTGSSNVTLRAGAEGPAGSVPSAMHDVGDSRLPSKHETLPSLKPIQTALAASCCSRRDATIFVAVESRDHSDGSVSMTVISASLRPGRVLAKA